MYTVTRCWVDPADGQVDEGPFPLLEAITVALQWVLRGHGRRALLTDQNGAIAAYLGTGMDALPVGVCLQDGVRSSLADALTRLGVLGKQGRELNYKEP